MLLFDDLPIELKSKIMYSGYIRHPLAILIDDFFNSIIPLISVVGDNPSILQHLCDIGELKSVEYLIWIGPDELIEYILDNHMFQE